MEIQPRRKGMTLALVLEMKEKLERQETIGLCSKDYPENIVRILKKEGVQFKIEEIEPEKYLEPIYSRDGYEEYISGYEEKTRPFGMFIFSSTLRVLP